jgi:hypothetical protein
MWTRSSGQPAYGQHRLVTLEVRGRRRGRLISFPVVEADCKGERDLVAMLGKDANWVRNVRAAEGRVVLRHAICTPSSRPPVDRRSYTGSRPALYLRCAARRVGFRS